MESITLEYNVNTINTADFSFKIAYCDISAQEYAYALKIRL